ncbi:DUF4136 domain-containing protein [Xylophilus sp. GOD-11R]|uniref:DUF4136 domain-containing protein n=1 Tax=Xylophilus sp. GOD-11R TaxID=3089814 RepID=UPI00298D4196|nr:DUF4136 domain-containing protein [Xylophilus sp. GOD-11R]WPB59037.1 DUF4136 domain-containing protein [Xylophilus sp. GOD-11R]
MNPIRTARRLWPALLLGAAAFLGGCASTVSTQVTNFNAWPADAAGGTFAFAPQAKGNAKELEQSTYEQYVREELERLGLKSAATGQVARFMVEVDASGSQRTVRSLQPMYQNYRTFIPARSGPNGTVIPGYWSADMIGGQYLGDREVARTLQVSKLRVQMRDRKPNAAAPVSVFESTAVYEGGMENLPDLVPYLARAAFDSFPGRNGQTREIRFDMQGGANAAPTSVTPITPSNAIR